MREILFRGKRLDNGEWVTGGYMQSWYKPPGQELGTISSCILPGEYRYWLATSELTHAEYWCSREISYDVISETVGQYTGLTDKNGKKIFEGDVVNNCLLDCDYPFCVVVWSEEDCCYYMSSIEGDALYEFHDVPCSELVVIGNIHDNPNMLNGGEAK